MACKSWAVSSPKVRMRILAESVFAMKIVWVAVGIFGNLDPWIEKGSVKIGNLRKTGGFSHVRKVCSCYENLGDRSALRRGSFLSFRSGVQHRSGRHGSGDLRRQSQRSEERRVGKECTSRLSPYH